MARTVYEQYPEYHTSADDKSFMGIPKLVEAVDVIEEFLRLLEQAGLFRNTQPYGEPMLGKRDLYPGVNSKDTREENEEFISDVLSILNYSDGDHPIVTIAERRDQHLRELVPAIEQLREEGLLVRASERDRRPPD
jgi:aminopeptidase-like protein